MNKFKIENLEFGRESKVEDSDLYHNIFKINPVITLLIDPIKDEIIDASNTACKFFGVSFDRLRLLKFTELFSSPGIESFIDLELIKSGNNPSISLNRVSINKETLDLRLKIVPYDLNGNTFLHISIEDTTERNLFELALMARDKNFKALIENSSDLILILNNSGEMVFISHSMQSILGFNPDNLISKNIFELIHPDDLEQTKFLFIKVISTTEENTKFNFRILNSGQEWINLEAVFKNMDSSPIINGIIVNARDITQRIKSEEVLRTNEELYRKLIELSPNAILLCSLDGDIILCNFQTVTLIRYDSPLELLGKNVFNLFSPSNKERARNDIIRLQDGIIIKNLEYAIIRKDSTEFPAEISCTIIKGVYGQPKSIFIIINDITIRKNYEDKLNTEREYLAQKVLEKTVKLRNVNFDLKKASRLKDEFLAIISHELKTPLNAIINMTQSLLEEDYGKITEKQSKSLRIIDQSSNQLLTLINDILDFSKIEAGKVEININEISIEDLGNTVSKIMHSLAEKKKIKFISQINRSEKKIHADERLLRQVIINLLGNAFKFTPEGGEVELKVTFDKESDIFQIQIRDSGIGILKEKMLELFKPFIQLDSELSRSYSGTGLGLALVYRIIKMHNGGIKVESEFGKGSIFTVLLSPDLPICFANHDFNDIKNIISAKRTRNSEIIILFIEENDLFINCISNSLNKIGLRIIFVRCREEVQEYLHKETPDIVFLNTQVSNFDELEIINDIRSDRGIFNLPVVAVSMLDLPGNKEKYIEMGFDDYTSLPLNPRNFENLILKNISAGNK